MSWWEFNRCLGETKLGKPCKRLSRRPYKRRRGDLCIPLTCDKHVEQEERLIKGFVG